MKNALSSKVASLMKKYPLYSQENEKNPLIVAKLFNSFGAGTWYLTEYEEETEIAFGYVTGLSFDEWGTVSVQELANI
jgi:hypothetical protein